jgi:hypothetical protein
MKKVWMTAVALAAVAGGASAQQTYVEGAYGVTQARLDCGDLLSCDKTDRGLKLIMGYQLSPQLSVEGGYLKLGRVRGTYALPAGDIVTSRIDTDALYLGGALRLPLDTRLPKLAVVLRAGVARVTSKEKVSPELIEGETATTWRPLLGAGLSYQLTPDLALMGGVDVTRSASLEVGSRQVRLFTLGAHYSFDLQSLVPGNALWRMGPPEEGAAVVQRGRSPRPNYAYAELGIVHSDALDVLKRTYPGAFEFDDNPSGFRLGLGRRWGPYWATELALTSYGQYDFRSASGVSPASKGSVAAAGVSVMSVWRAQTDMDLTWVARLGLSHNASRIETQTGSVTTTDDRRTTAPIYGLGLEHALDKDWRLMLTADTTRIRVGNDRPAVKFYAAGGSYRF